MIITYGLTLAVVIPVFLVSLLLPDLRIVSDNGHFALWVVFAVPLPCLLMSRAYSLWLHLDFGLEPWTPTERSQFSANRRVVIGFGLLRSGGAFASAGFPGGIDCGEQGDENHDGDYIVDTLVNIGDGAA
jgi:hypothetical protein